VEKRQATGPPPPPVRVYEKQHAPHPRLDHASPGPAWCLSRPPLTWDPSLRYALGNGSAKNFQLSPPASSPYTQCHAFEARAVLYRCGTTSELAPLIEPAPASAPNPGWACEIPSQGVFCLLAARKRSGACSTLVPLNAILNFSLNWPRKKRRRMVAESARGLKRPWTCVALWPQKCHRPGSLRIMSIVGGGRCLYQATQKRPAVDDVAGGSVKIILAGTRLLSVPGAAGWSLDWWGFNFGRPARQLKFLAVFGESPRPPPKRRARTSAPEPSPVYRPSHTGVRGTRTRPITW